MVYIGRNWVPDGALVKLPEKYPTNNATFIV